LNLCMYSLRTSILSFLLKAVSYALPSILCCPLIGFSCFFHLSFLQSSFFYLFAPFSELFPPFSKSCYLPIFTEQLFLLSLSLYLLSLTLAKPIFLLSLCHLLILPPPMPTPSPRHAGVMFSHSNNM
jgi:hypothetical protein